MSAILAVTASVGHPRLQAALPAFRRLGGDQERIWSGEDTLLAVTRKGWELEPDHSGPILLVERPDLIVAVDATLYDRAGLMRDLAAAGVSAAGATPGELIEAAYRAWGAGLARHLTGDFAFAIWDRRLRRLIAARDPLGMRPLYVARLGDQMAVGSSSRSLAELPAEGARLNVACLGAQVAGIVWMNGLETAYEGVEPLPAGHVLVWETGRSVVQRFWQPPAAPDRRPSPAEEAARELRDLLGTAVVERMGSGTTSVWMSGGWDSTAVFGAGQQSLQPSERAGLRPISISYPEGDPGREDELIAAVARHWGSEVHWIASGTIPLVEGLAERSAATDEPPAHLYELWNRALARGTRAVGARIALDGCGGDNLFQVSDVVLADLLRTGHLLEFARRSAARRSLGWRYLARTAVLPLLPGGLVRGLERVSGRELPRHYMEHRPAPWVRKDFLAAHRLRERALETLGVPDARGRAQRENMLYVSHPAWGWGGNYMRGVLLLDGVEVRSPLLDRRVVEFALRRPVAERADRSETKILLRRAMRGLLPAEVLAPRPRRTGSTAGFSRERMQQAYPALLGQLFGEPLRLADLGVVDPAALRTAADRWLERGDESVRVRLFDAMRVEFWLRAREAGTGLVDRAPAVRVQEHEYTAA